jgi:hypothetical protein
MDRHRIHVLIVATVAAFVTYSLTDYVVDGARWWNLVMVMLLLLALAAYLWQARNRQGE